MRGQYTRRRGRRRSAVPGYAEELGRRTARTETFVALRAEIDNWRWAGVPFYLRTGKRMARALLRDRHQLQARAAFDLRPRIAGASHANRLVIRLQPDEGVKLR